MGKPQFAKACPLTDYGPRLRRCADCGRFKSIGLFRVHKRRTIGRNCKSCYNAAQREKWHAEPERRRYYGAKWKQRNPDKVWDSGLWYKYRITAEQFYQILESQGGGCAVCGAGDERGVRSLSVDHDHSCCPGKRSCGKCVRGILCGDCNRAEGLLKSDAGRVRRLLNYLNGQLPGGLDLATMGLR